MLATTPTHTTFLRSFTGGRSVVVDLSSPIVTSKAIKNAAELEGMREAHLRDAVAICDFLNWLETKVGVGLTGRQLKPQQRCR
jgi:Xaa-Pro aminopeptidase